MADPIITPTPAGATPNVSPMVNTPQPVAPKNGIQGMYNSLTGKIDYAGEPGVLSTEQGVNNINSAQTKLANITSAPGTPPAPPEPPAPAKGSVDFLNPDTGQKQSVDSTSLTPEIASALEKQGYFSVNSSGSVPSWFTTGNLDSAKAEAANASALKNLNDLKGQIAQFGISDAALKAQTDSISQMWDSRIADTQKIIDSQVAAENTLGIRLGSQYSGGVMKGIVSEVEQQGVQRIAGLNAQKEAAISAAQDAARTQNWQVFQKQTDLADKLYQQTHDEMAKLNQNIQDANAKVQQQLTDTNRDIAVASLLKNGTTDVGAIVSALKDKGIIATAADVQKSLGNLESSGVKDMGTILKQAATNGAPQAIQDAISKTSNLQDAIKAAGGYLQNATGTLGDYLQYKRDAEAKGLTPMDYTTYKDNEAFKAEQIKNKSDAAYTASDKVQQSLEKQGRDVIVKEFSSRAGALGSENLKVNQANHLDALFTQYYDPKTGNYNIPVSQYHEIAIGLANLVAGSTGVAQNTIDKIDTATAKGDFNAAIQWATGTPQNGSTQDIIKNMLDSIDRQASVAVANRQGALENMKSALPTDLEQSRRDALIKATNMVPYSGADRISKSRVNEFISNNSTLKIGNQNASDFVANMYEQPGATDQNVEDWLTKNGYIK